MNKLTALKAISCLIFLLGFVGLACLTGCDDRLMDNSNSPSRNRNTNEQRMSYPKKYTQKAQPIYEVESIYKVDPIYGERIDYDYDDEVYKYKKQAAREREFRYYQEDRARLERQEREARFAMERSRNRAERSRLKRKLHEEQERRKQAQEAQISADRGLAERLQAEENARFAREIITERSRSSETRNTGQASRENGESAARQRAIDEQITSDRAMAERLQREEMERL